MLTSLPKLLTLLSFSVTGLDFLMPPSLYPFLSSFFPPTAFTGLR